MDNHNLTEQEESKLVASKNEDEWNAICDEVKAARGGKYPPDWFARVMMSGLGARAQERWKS